MNLLLPGIEALRAQFGRDVVALDVAALVREQVIAAELVAAGLDQEAQRHAGALRLGALRRRRHLHLIVGVVVAEELIPDDAVELDQLAARAAVRSRAGRRRSADGVAADVELRRRQAGHEPRQAADAASVRQILHLLLAPVHADLRRLEVDRRRRADDGHRLRQVFDLERRVHRHRGVGGDDDALDRERAKAGELKLHLVDAGRHQR